MPEESTATETEPPAPQRRPPVPRRPVPWAAVSIGVVGVLVLAAVFAYPAVTSDNFITDVATDMALWATLAIGLNAVLGWAGLLDLGYIAFFAIGGYVYAILSQAQILQFWPALIAGLAVSAVAAVIIGVPSLRLQSDYLAIMTLGFGEIVYIAATNLTGLTGGTNGLFEFSPPSIGDFQFSAAGAFYGMAVVLLVVAAAVSGMVRHSRLGRAWMSLRDDELAARSFGVSVWRSKLFAYVYGSVWGTLAGAVFAAKQTIVSPTSFSYDQSFYVLAAVVIGGMGSVWGAAIGGIVYVFLSEALQGVTSGLSGVVFGGLMLLVILLRPQGLVPVGAVTRALDRLSRRPTAGAASKAGSAPTADRTPPARQPSKAPGAVLSGQGLSVSYGGARAVHGVNLTCRSGQVLALIGSNGAGKTTLLNALSGFVSLQAGTITHVRGDDVLDLTGMSPQRRARSGLARSFQTPRLSRTESVVNNAWRGTLATTGSHRAAAARVEQALDIVGLRTLGRTAAGELSYGDQRRCEIARALAGNPDFLLLDEPSSGMNDVETTELSALLRQIADQGIGIILVEHDMNLVQSVADTVLAMDIGETVAFGNPQEVLANPTVRSRYLGED